MGALEWVDRGATGAALRIPLTPAERAALERATDLDECVRVFPDAALKGPRAVPISALQTMSGTLTTDGPDAVVFEPRYPFVPGAAYVVRIELAARRTESIERPARRAQPSTEVVAIRPALTEVPRNLLRLYIEFSAPMSEGEAARCVRLVDAASGEPLSHALLSLDPELWDAARRRLTVLLDPARIKRGLAPHLAAGYPLVEGQAVGLVIDPAFRDAAGQPLIAGAGRRFVVGADLRGRVDPILWQTTAPAVSTSDGLLIEFDRPIDVALAVRCLVVVGPDAEEVAGRGTASDDGTAWLFEPTAPWRAGAYRVLVDPSLEDVAGNSMRRVFDRDVDDPRDDPAPDASVAVAFAVV